MARMNRTFMKSQHSKTITIHCRLPGTAWAERFKAGKKRKSKLCRRSANNNKKPKDYKLKLTNYNNNYNLKNRKISKVKINCNLIYKSLKMHWRNLRWRPPRWQSTWTMKRKRIRLRRRRILICKSRAFYRSTSTNKSSSKWRTSTPTRSQRWRDARLR